MKRALLLFAAVLGSLALAAVRADADSVGTLQVNLTLSNQFDGNGVACPAGSSETTVCFHNIPRRGTNLAAGLGVVTYAPYTFIWEGYGTPCGSVHGQIAILVAGKGEIDVAIAASGCWTSDNFPPAAVTVSGGSGRYVGATGDGSWEFHLANITGPLAGSRDVTWTGTLNVAGLAFDTTPPQITGATSKVVKTKLAAGAKVRYSVSATDATDGTVAAACLPKSGSLFQVGHTTVSCNPTDSSGNTTTARFVITVKRVRR
jgi:hypothetical protein